MHIDRSTTPGTRVLGVVLGCFLLAPFSLSCARKSDPKQRLTAPGLTSAAGSLVAAPSTSAAQPAVRPLHPAEQFVFAWSAILNRRAAEELAPFYGAHVLFYGQRKSAAEVLAAKRLAFEKSPSYQQRVSALHIEKVANGFVVRFQKRSGARLEALVPARLALETIGDHLAIVDESDDVTDQRFKPSSATNCGEAVSEIVMSNALIQKDIARVAREDPSVNPGGITYIEEPDRIQSAQGYMHEDRFEARWWIEAGGGKLSVVDAYSHESLNITPAQAAIVRRLCTGIIPDGGD